MTTANPREDQHLSQRLGTYAKSDRQNLLWNYLTEGSLDHIEMDLVSSVLEKWQEMGIENVQAGHAIQDGIEVFGAKLKSATTDILCASDVNPSFARLVLAKTNSVLRRKSHWNQKASRQSVASPVIKLPEAELIPA